MLSLALIVIAVLPIALLGSVLSRDKHQLDMAGRSTDVLVSGRVALSR